MYLSVYTYIRTCTHKNLEYTYTETLQRACPKIVHVLETITHILIMLLITCEGMQRNRKKPLLSLERDPPVRSVLRVAVLAQSMKRVQNDKNKSVSSSIWAVPAIGPGPCCHRLAKLASCAHELLCNV